MIRANGKRQGFTLIELLVVVAMVAILMGALTTSVSASMKRARIQRATGEVKSVTQAILGYENFARGSSYQLPAMERQDADSGSLGFLLGKGESSDSGAKIPAVLMASLSSGGKMRDPWGTPYKITIRKGNSSLKVSTATAGMQTRYYFPNFYRLGKNDRDLEGDE